MKYNYLCGNFKSDAYEAKLAKSNAAVGKTKQQFMVKGKDGKTKKVEINAQATQANSNKIKQMMDKNRCFDIF